MIQLHYQGVSVWVRCLGSVMICMQLMSCISPAQSRSSGGEWEDLSVFVDGIMKVNVSLPPSGPPVPKSKNQLKVSETNKLTTIFVKGYNPGRGKYQFMDLVHITGTVTRIEGEFFDSTPIDFEDIKQTLYFSKPEIKGDFEIIGPESIGGNKWLRVNFIGEAPRKGVAYFRPVYGRYALMISMRMFGVDSDQTKIYKERHEDLKKVLQSVEVTVEDFELQRANQK